MTPSTIIRIDSYHPTLLQPRRIHRIHILGRIDRFRRRRRPRDRTLRFLSFSTLPINNRFPFANTYALVRIGLRTKPRCLSSAENHAEQSYWPRQLGLALRNRLGSSLPLAALASLLSFHTPDKTFATLGLMALCIGSSCIMLLIVIKKTDSPDMRLSVYICRHYMRVEV